MALQAPFLGFAISAGLFQFVVLTSAIGWQAQISLAEAFRSILTWGLIGVVVAVAALIGGMTAVALVDRRLQRAAIVRVSWAGVGAGMAVLTECIVFGFVVSDSGWPLGYVMFGVIAGIVAATTAATLVNRAERRAARAPESTVNEMTKAI
ncbi:hypothetical protein D9V28_14900 [Mycetocola zhadangensis]|uniref:Uncharacterized protein n=1 Tax=Mycetocola zhadangensis TaxID=1164595 RepID=A0A3L7ISC2_9MICO|nr:hypothetical protein D9V28_14900 [Mycetocola zhadangensis]